MGACLILDALFYKTKGLGACGRAQPCGIEQPTMTEEAVVVEGACLLVDALFKKTRGLGACVREQPRGIEQPTMTDEANLVDKGMSNSGCGFFDQTKGVGCVWSGAALWSSAAYHEGGWGRVVENSLVE